MGQRFLNVANFSKDCRSNAAFFPRNPIMIPWTELLAKQRSTPLGAAGMAWADTLGMHPNPMAKKKDKVAIDVEPERGVNSGVVGVCMVAEGHSYQSRQASVSSKRLQSMDWASCSML